MLSRLKKQKGEPRNYQETISELNLQRAKAHAIFRSIGDGAITTDGYGKIEDANQAALAILGAAKKDLVGSWYHSCVSAFDMKGEPVPPLDRPTSQAMITGEAISSRMQYRKKNGKLIPVAVTVSPIILDGKPIGAVEVFRDITNEVELDKAKDEFVSLASHELRTPATAVKNFIGLLKEGYAGDLSEEQKFYVDQAYESNEEQLSTINVLLQTARGDSGRLKLSYENFDLQKMIISVINEQKIVIDGRNQSVATAFTGKSMEVSADPSLIRLVVQNVISNASKYTPTGGKIDVSLTVKNKFAVFKVKDTGVGIKKPDLKKLFLKFSRIDNPLSGIVGGTGLGLYLTKQIIDLHRGKLEVTSKVGSGTTFKITIPRSKENG